MKMKKQKIKRSLKSLTISRERWGKHALLTSSNKMCCLGFACNALGYDLKELNKGHGKRSANRLGLPDDIIDFNGPKWMAGHDAQLAATANDTLKGKEREQEVKRIFAKHGCKVQFVK